MTSISHRSAQSIALLALVVMLVLVAIFGSRGSSQFWLQVRIIAVGLLTFGSAFYFVKGVQLGFSRVGGWKAARGSLAWALSALMLAASQLWKGSDPVPSSYLSVLAGFVAVAAVTFQRRAGEEIES